MTAALWIIILMVGAFGSAVVLLLIAILFMQVQIASKLDEAKKERTG